MKTRLLAFLAFTFILSAAFAQSNKVLNPSFEELEKKVKKAGEFTNVASWYIPEGCPAVDLFSSEVKKGDVTAPDNYRGSAESLEGNNYAGLLVYSERESQPRTFIQTKLEKKLLPGKKYCIKMDVSLSDVSKYSSNHIGMYLSSKAIKLRDIEKYDITPQLLPPKNVIVEETYDWVPLCTTIVAEGVERYVTIGNFAPQSGVATGKKRRSREFSQAQTRDAYYFVDEVSITPVELLDGSCFCPIKSDDDGKELQIEYTKNVSEDHEGTDAEKIEITILHYGSNAMNLDEEAMAYLRAVAEIIKNDASIKVDIIGHTDMKEVASLGEERAKKVYAQLTSVLGVSANQLEYKSEGADNPIQGNETATGRAQNRRVQFVVRD